MGLIQRPSPNFDARSVPVDILLLHYTGMTSAKAALDRLCDPAAKVSAHYLIDEDGTVWQMVDEANRAWHAGVSSWRGCRDINGASIGIELVNPGHEFGYRAFPEAQMTALEALATGILARHAIIARNVIGHSDVAPMRKQDPGELFDWARLARAGVGFWTNFTDLPPAPKTKAELQTALAAIGYGLSVSGILDEETKATITAFQRHFRPLLCDGVPDDETGQRIAHLANQV